MRKSNTFFQVGYMYMQGTLRGAACALLMMVWLGLGSASGADFSAAEIVASGGTQRAM